MGAIFLLLAAFPGHARANGDGSGSSNPALLRGGVAQNCAYWWQCQNAQPRTPKSSPSKPKFQTPPPRPVVPAVQQADCGVLPSGANTPQNCPVDLGAGAPMAAGPPVIAQHQPQNTSPEVSPITTGSIYNASPEVRRVFALEPDWNIGLRGGFENGSNGSRFVMSILPSASLRRGFSRGDVTLAGSSEIALEQGGGVRIASGRVAVNANYAIGRNTSLSGGAALTASQESAFAPGATVGISAQPLIVTGTANGTIEHQLGRLGLAARGSLARQVYGTTQMQSGAVVDNASLSRFTFGGGLRASYGVSRTTRLFVDGALERNVYDAISPTAGVKLDSWTWGLRGGLSMNFGRVVQAELAGGYGMRQFDNAGLAATPAWLASAEIRVRPEERLSFTGTLSTEFAVPDSGTSTTEIDYLAGLAVQYRVNNQIGLRASVSGEWRDVIGAPDGWDINASAGADFAINKQTTLTGDYTFSTGQTGGAARQDSHQISLGVRYGRTRLGVSTP